jgi:ATP-dependent Lon protease
MDLDVAQNLLELDSASAKLHKLTGILAHELEVLELGQKIQNEARSEIEKVQRDYFLREQLKAIQRELGESDEQAVEVEEFRKKIEAAGMPPEAETQARRELDRLSRLPTAAAEYGVIRTYLDWLVSLPWSAASQTTWISPMPARCSIRTTTACRTSKSASWNTWQSASCATSAPGELAGRRNR